MNSRQQIQMQGTLAVLQTRGDQFTRQLLQEKQRIAQLETKLKDVNEKTSSVRELNKTKAVELLNMHTTTTNGAYKRADGLDPTRLAEINQKKLVNNLEGRLNKALVRQNNIQSENNTIKSKIDKLRRKVHNDSINRKCTERKLEEIQDDVNVIMKKASISAEQRDKIIEHRNQSIRENMDEKEIFIEDFAKLSMHIAAQKDLLENSIASVSNDIVSNFKPNHAGVSDLIPDDSVNPIDEVKALDEKVTELDKQYEASKQTLKQTEEKNRSYEEAFKELQEVSALTITDDIIKAFLKNEEESFSLFNYIQTVNQECDTCVEEHIKVKREIEAYTKEQSQQENHRASICNNYKERLEEVQGERKRLKNGITEGKITILEIAKNVQTLYIKLRCRELQKKMGDSNLEGKKMGDPKMGRMTDRKLTMFSGEQISERNILHHMELIEKRSIQIIAEYAKKLATNRKGQRRPSVLLVGSCLS